MFSTHYSIAVLRQSLTTLVGQVKDKDVQVLHAALLALVSPQPGKAKAMSAMLHRDLMDLPEATERFRPKTSEERYISFRPSLQAKLTLENGRLYTTITGIALPLNVFLLRLEHGGHNLSRYSSHYFEKMKYDELQRLKSGKVYKLAFVFNNEIPRNEDCQGGVSVEDVQAFGVQVFGEQAVTGLRGEIAFLLREKFTDEDLADLDVMSIEVLPHVPVPEGGRPVTFNLDRLRGRSEVGVGCGNPQKTVHGLGAFVFLVEESN